MCITLVRHALSPCITAPSMGLYPGWWPWRIKNCFLCAHTISRMQESKAYDNAMLLVGHEHEEISATWQKCPWWHRGLKSGMQVLFQNTHASSETSFYHFLKEINFHPDTKFHSGTTIFWANYRVISCIELQCACRQMHSFRTCFSAHQQDTASGPQLPSLSLRSVDPWKYGNYIPGSGMKDLLDLVLDKLEVPTKR